MMHAGTPHTHEVEVPLQDAGAVRQGDSGERCFENREAALAGVAPIFSPVIEKALAELEKDVRLIPLGTH